MHANNIYPELPLPARPWWEKAVHAREWYSLTCRLICSVDPGSQAFLHLALHRKHREWLLLLLLRLLPVALVASLNGVKAEIHPEASHDLQRSRA